ncbi:MAG: type I glyceraldehyde-3-phosphate dehydrogenase [Elusimicrobia bacterium]|nr:type I glyceraldehyde-3-phosphate dehydrogenase [Elusimicrobiota bacterium]MBI4217764.1 type I glyceraldehyde-3-phosphate dehydrogenase [Elusimicrobiota bacterium]
MPVRVGINGFGRIGRLVLKAGLKNKNIQFVAVNDLTDAKTSAYLFKYDSNFGVYPGTVEAKDSSIFIDGKELRVIAEKDPAKLPWKDLGVDIVIESTGRFTDAEKAKAHMLGGAKKVVISAPAKGEDITICMGINEQKYDPAKHHILSNASCTTNCLAPIVKILNESFKVKRGLMTTIHSYTNDQVILDFPHKDLRRARAAGQSMIPTTTGAAKAIGLVIPELKGKLNGIAIRVPTPNVSLVDLAAEIEKGTSKEEINAAFKKAATGNLSKYLQYIDSPLVSKDFNGNDHSCIFDSLSTDVMEGNLVKVFGWYDNEWGYSNRVVDLVDYISSKN